MLSFRSYSYLAEGRYPTWVKLTVGALVVKCRGLSQQIKNESDPKKQNDLISQQNALLSYISGLGVGVSSRDRVLLNRLKKGFVSPKR